MSGANPIDHSLLMRQALEKLEEADRKIRALERGLAEPIAIVGMGCRFPGGASDPERYWELLAAGVDTVADVPASRWDRNAWHDPDPATPGKMYCSQGSFLEDIDRFDARFFGIAPREAALMDPQQRVLLEVSWEALERAAISPAGLAGSRTGVVFGVVNGDYFERVTRPAHAIDVHTGSGAALSIAAGRLSYVLGLQGPALVVDTACSTSLVAVHLACQSLRTRETDLALAGGANVILSPTLSVIESRARLLSPGGRCRTFDAAADGVVRGEGCGVVVLKRLADALAQGDRVLAVIRGSAVNHDGRSGGLTVPNGPAQEAVIRLALANAAVSARDVTYVEAHGTGTPLGDPIELEALGAVYGEGRPAATPLLVGSVKTNFGHLEAAAGIAGLIKIVLMLQHRAAPPHLHFETPNPRVDWKQLSIAVPRETVAWPAGGSRRLAGVSSFGFSGTNAHLVVEEAPPAGREPVAAREPAAIDRPLHVLALSAKTPAALDALRAQVDDFLGETRESPADIAFTANTGRAHFPHRIAACGKTVADLREALRHASAHRADDLPPRIAFVFGPSNFGPSNFGPPGCASPCLTGELYRTQPTFRAVIDRCRELSSRRSLNGAAEWLAVELAIAEVWKSWGVEPQVAAGTGIGELAAGTFAGLLSLKEALAIANLAFANQDLPPGSVTRDRRSRPEFISARTGDRMETVPPDYWLRTVGEPRRTAGEPRDFDKALRTIRREGCDIFLELSPQPFLEEAQTEALTVPSLTHDGGEWSSILSSLATLYRRGVAVDWQAFDRPYRRRKVLLPTYPFQRQSYWVERPVERPVELPVERLAETPAGAQPLLHPLLGRRVHAVSLPREEMLFEAALGERLPAFIADHRIDDTAVLPATAYLEMALAAGRVAFGSESLSLRDVAFEHAMIFLPGALAPGAQRLAQVLLRAPQSGDRRFEIYSRDPDESEWTLHSHGLVGHAATEAPPALPALGSQPAEELSVTRYYADAAQGGLQFGPRFRGMEQLWQLAGGSLARACLPPEFASEAAPYRFHPGFLDSCLQVAGVGLAASSDGWVDVPAGIERFTALAPAAPTVWAYSCSSGESRFDVSLYGENGEPMAVMRGLQMKRVRRSALLAPARDTDEDCLYRIQWIPKPLPAGPAGDLPAPSAIRRQVQAVVTPEVPAAALETYALALRDLERLSSLYMVHALRELGWDPAADPRPSAGSLGIVPTYGRFLNSCLDILRREGVPDRNVARDVEPAAARLALAHPGFQPEFDMLRRCGSRLPDVLRGQCDPLQLLFPGAAIAEVETLYSNSPLLGLMHATVRHAVAAACAERPPGLPFRVLEIGAGSGATTRHILPVLPPGTEYDFTDLSPVFLDAAAARFADFPFLRYRLLDIEKSPRARGFPPGRYHLIIASNVFHATADLRRTLAHTRELLADGGLLLLTESTVVLNWVQLTFGLTEGWWKFSDTDLRASTPLLPAERWRTLLRETGFEDPELASLDGDPILAQQAVLVARAPRRGRRWLIVPDSQGAAAGLAAALEKRGDAVTVAGALASQFETRFSDIVHLASLDAPAPDASTVAGDFDIAARLGCGSVLQLTQTLAGVDSRDREYDPPRLWLVTRGAQPGLPGDDGSGLAQSPLIGMARALAREIPELASTLIDLDPLLAAGNAATQLLPELQSGDGEEEIALRMGQLRMGQLRMSQRFVPRLRRARLAAPRQTVIRPDRSYLITGGWGGIGLLLAEWLADHGARHLVLVGRSSPSESVLQQVERLRHRGCNIVWELADVSDFAAFSAAWDRSRRAMPPFAGVVHAAGALDDGVLVRQTWEGFARALAPKVQGAWNLHRLTADEPLEFFVLFSSAVSLLGATGQANHTAANVFLDALAHYRRAHGRPALAIDWGGWSGVGAADRQEAGERLRKLGMQALSPAQALHWFEKLLSADEIQVGVMPIDWAVFRNEFSCSSFLRDLLPSASAGPGKPPLLLERLALAPPGEQWQILAGEVRRQVAAILGFASDAEIDSRQRFFDAGIDSLTAIELKNRLSAAVGSNLRSTLIFDFPTVTSLTEYLGREVLALAAPSEPVPGHTEDAALLQEVAAMSDAQIEALIALELEPECKANQALRAGLGN